MDIHKPKAAHGVREFLIEIGTMGLKRAKRSRNWPTIWERPRVTSLTDGFTQAMARTRDA